MGSGLTAHIALGMVVGLGIGFLVTDVFRIRHTRLYSGLFVIGSGLIFAVPVLFRLFKENYFYSGAHWWSGPLIIICYHLIYLNYIVYIRRAFRRRGPQ